MTLKRRITAALGTILVLIALAAVTPSAASAAPVTTGSNGSTGVVSPAGKPTGCPSGYFCAWVGTNGDGENCADFPYYLNVSSWVYTDCWGRVATIFNNSISCSGCDSIYLFYLTDYAGAYTILGRGDYYLDLSKNRFNRGSGSSGYNTAMKNNIRSSFWG
jgi:hypothetical protein